MSLTMIGTVSAAEAGAENERPAANAATVAARQRRRVTGIVGFLPMADRSVVSATWSGDC